MAAALAIVARDGAAALNVRGVCAEAGLVPRYFYEEFGDTDALARQLFDREFDGGIARVGTAVAAVIDGSNLVKAEAAVGAVLDFVTELPGRSALLLTEASGSGVLAQRRQERMADVVAVVAGFGRASYGTGAEPPTPESVLAAEQALQVASAFVAGGLSRTVDDWIGGRIDVPRGGLARELAAQIVAVGDTAFALLSASLNERA